LLYCFVFCVSSFFLSFFLFIPSLALLLSHSFSGSMQMPDHGLP
jgi:hypothetical protein